LLMRYRERHLDRTVCCTLFVWQILLEQVELVISYINPVLVLIS
jgi:hypothetical protein